MGVDSNGLGPERRTRVRNDLFDARRFFERGRPLWVEATWHVLKCTLFLPAWPVPSMVKRAVLRLFGARIGKGVVIKPRVNIHLPWKLSVGDFTWIGEEAFILNLEPVCIGTNCCISQRAFLCTGSHDYRELDMPYRNRPIRIGDGAWVGAQSLVAPGVNIGKETVVTAGSIVTHSLPAGMVCRGNPCLPVRPRWSVQPGTELQADLEPEITALSS